MQERLRTKAIAIAAGGTTIAGQADLPSGASLRRAVFMCGVLTNPATLAIKGHDGVQAVFQIASSAVATHLDFPGGFGEVSVTLGAGTAAVFMLYY